MQFYDVNVYALALKCCSSLTKRTLLTSWKRQVFKTVVFAQQIVKLRPRVPKGLQLSQRLLIMGEKEQKGLSSWAGAGITQRSITPPLKREELLWNISHVHFRSHVLSSSKCLFARSCIWENYSFWCYALLKCSYVLLYILLLNSFSLLWCIRLLSAYKNTGLLITS